MARTAPWLLVWILALALCVTGFSGRAMAQEGKTGARRPAPFVHVVIFRLKKNAPEGEADALIADAHALLRKIPSVRALRAGKPARAGTPERERKDYDVGLVVFFENSEGLHAYLNHPLHLKYVDKHLKYVQVDRLPVYDFVDHRK